jgi:protein dithiol oxidoreductase (disulfide-forming)
MNGLNRLQQGFLALVMGALLCVGHVSAAEPVEGRDYRRIQSASPPENAGKIEVVEFFSYACPHCAQFNPQITQWAEKLPSGVVFKRVPVLFNRAPWANLAKLYYALEVMGELPALDQAVFTAMHKDGENLADPRALNEWLVKKNVNIQKFNEAYNAFGIGARVKRGDQMSRDYAVDGVPAIAVNGMYMINSELPHDQQLHIAEALIAKLRGAANQATFSSAKTKK